MQSIKIVVKVGTASTLQTEGIHLYNRVLHPLSPTGIKSQRCEGDINTSHRHYTSVIKAQVYKVYQENNITFKVTL